MVFVLLPVIEVDLRVVTVAAVVIDKGKKKEKEEKKLRSRRYRVGF